MADRIELFERRNRLRIVALVLLATLNYIVAVVMAAIAVGIGIALAIIFYGGDVFSDTHAFVFFVIGLAESLQVWALREQGVERDRVAVQFTRNPASLVHPLEKLDADASTVRHVSRATGPLWLEFPAHVLGPSPSRATRRLARELLLDERIDHLRELAGDRTRPVTR